MSDAEESCPSKARGSFIDAAVRLCGEDVLKELSRHSGRKMYVPVRPEPHHVLSAAIGHENAVAIAKEYGGDFISIPMLFRQSVIDMLMDGRWSVADIVDATRASRRCVFEVKAALRRSGQLPPTHWRKP